MARCSLGLPGLPARSASGGAQQGAASLFSPGPRQMWTINGCCWITWHRHTWVWQEGPQLMVLFQISYYFKSLYLTRLGSVLWPRKIVFSRNSLCHVTFWPQVSVGRLRPLVATALMSSPVSPRLVSADGSCCSLRLWWNTTAGQTGLHCCLSTWLMSTSPLLTCWVTTVVCREWHQI